MCASAIRSIISRITGIWSRCFAWSNNYLDPGGVFIFDFNTLHKYRDILGDRTIAENRETESFIWDNYFDEESRINEYELAVFVREGACADGTPLYRKYEEVHYQKAYETEELKQALREAGLEFEAAYDGFSGEPARADSERICVVARESGKTPALRTLKGRRSGRGGGKDRQETQKGSRDDHE